LDQLRSVIGKSVEYRGSACRIIEVLHSEHALVVECQNEQHVIQGDQYGEAHRRVRQCYTLALFDHDGQLDPLIQLWLD
jgi:hypothetical protein